MEVRESAAAGRGSHGVRAAPIDHGEAGGSARREYDRRSARREMEVRDRHPVVGGFLLAMTGEPQATRAWAQGAIGEQIVGRHLDQLAGRGVVTLHDRRVPRSAANIDHLAVAPSGIFVIDAKYRAGRKVEMRKSGGFLHWGPRRLVVGGRDAGPMLEASAWQLTVVRRALRSAGVDGGVPLRAMLVLVEAQWGRSTSGLVVGRVDVLWPKAMASRVGAPGPLSPEIVTRLAECLAAQLPPA
jgi:hypothetical protein